MGFLYQIQLSASSHITSTLDVPCRHKEGFCLLKCQHAKYTKLLKQGQTTFTVPLYRVCSQTPLPFLLHLLLTFQKSIPSLLPVMIYDSYCLDLVWIWPVLEKHADFG